LDLRAYDAPMPNAAFATIIMVLLALRLYSLACLGLAWDGAYLDPSTWATGEAITTELVTPFHGHENPFGFIFQIFVTLHNLTGVALFAVCLVPLFVKKGGRAHKLFGRAFVILWILHLIDGLSNSGTILIARGFDATRYYDVTGQGFSLYLYIQFAFISSMVIDFLANGLAAIHYKNRAPSAAMRAVMLFLPITSALFGVGIAIWGVLRLMSGVPPETPNTIPFAVVFVVQVPVYLYLLYRNIRYWARPTPKSWLHGWTMEHQRNLMFCVQVTLYTGIANVGDRFAPALTPILFGLIDVGFIVWILTKERAMRRHVAKSRLGLALVTALHGEEGSEPKSELTEREEAWIRRLFDLDADGNVELADVRALLEAQGVTPTEDEIERLRGRLDHDGDGRIDSTELARFLAAWFTTYPSNEDELRLAFRSLDADGDGRISPQDLSQALRQGDDGLSPDEIDWLMRLTDLDGSGAIEWDEFLRAIHTRAKESEGGAYLARETIVN
jgi:Ca2+-binding EF-hand superfamily protein